MAGSDDFQNKLNRSAQPVGGDFSYQSSGGTGNNGQVDQDMRINTPNVTDTWDQQVQREKALPGILGINGGYSTNDRSGNRQGSKGGSRFANDEKFVSSLSPESNPTIQYDDFNSGAIANKYIQAADNNQTVNIEALDRSIRMRPLYHEAKGRMEDLNTYGDMYAYGRNELPEYKQPEPMKGVESPDFEGMYERTKKDLDDYKI